MDSEKGKISNQLKEKNINATLFIGNLDYKINEEILWELFIQVGPIGYCIYLLATLILPRDKVDLHHFGYCFIEYESELDCDYAIKIFNPIKLFNKVIAINKLNNNPGIFEVGATIFIGNLSKEVNEKLLYDSFSNFGVITKMPKILNSYKSKKIKRFGIVTYGSFESSDAAIYAMNGQYFSGCIIYAVQVLIFTILDVKHGNISERLFSENIKLFHNNFTYKYN